MIKKGDCRARSDPRYEYVQTDRALHFPQNKSIVTNYMIRVKLSIMSVAVVGGADLDHTVHTRKSDRRCPLTLQLRGF